MANIIKANKLYTFSTEDTKYKPPTKEEIIEELTTIPAVLMRGHRDEVIEMNAEADPPILKWKISYLNNMDQHSLSILRDFARNRYEFTKRK